MTRRIRVHFDAAHDRKSLAAVQRLVQGLPRERQMKVLADSINKTWDKLQIDEYLRRRSGRGVERYPVRDFRWIESCLVIRAGIDATQRTFAEIRKDAVFTELIGNNMPSAPDANVQARFVVHAGRYLLDGCKTFHVEPALSRLFAGVDLDGVTGADIVPPFPAFYVSVGDSAGLCADSGTEVRPLAGLYVLVEDGDDPVGSYSVGVPCRTLRIIAVGDWFMKPFDRDSNVMVPDDVLRFWQVPLVDAWPIADSLAYQRRTAIRADGSLFTEREYERAGFAPTTRWLLNAILYATSPDRRAEVHAFDPRARALARKLRNATNPKTRKRTAQQLAGMDRRTYTVLSAPTSSNSTHGEDTGRKLDKRVQVCAHWKRQAYGPRRSLRKQILIQPYERGPIGAPDSNPIRVLR